MKIINELYLNSGNKLTKIALCALPQNDDELIQNILNHLQPLILDDEGKEYSKDMLMTVVKTERNRGGKRKTYTRKRRNRKYK